MPQITVEFTKNIAHLTDYRDVALKLHHLLVEEISTALEDCKTRLSEIANYVVGDGRSDEAFIHITFAMLSGRPLALKDSFGAKALKIVSEAIPFDVVQNSIQITVEIRDLDRDTYKKEIIHKSMEF